MRPKCAKCHKVIRDDDEVIYEFGKEYHKGCCPHRRIKRNYPFGRKSKPSMDCLACGKIIKGKDLQEIRKIKEREQKKRKRGNPEDDNWKKVTKEALRHGL